MEDCFDRCANCFTTTATSTDNKRYIQYAFEHEPPIKITKPFYWWQAILLTESCFTWDTLKRYINKPIASVDVMIFVYLPFKSWGNAKSFHLLQGLCAMRCSYPNVCKSKAKASVWRHQVLQLNARECSSTRSKHPKTFHRLSPPMRPHQTLAQMTVICLNNPYPCFHLFKPTLTGNGHA